jgi:hypothetical protein
MRRKFLVVTVVLLAQLGLAIGVSGTASAVTILAGGPPTGCTQATSAAVDPLESVTSTGTGDLKVSLSVTFTCSSYSTVTPTVTSLSGVLKATLDLAYGKFARKCSNFESTTTPNDLVIKGKGTITWMAGGIGSVKKSTFLYGPATTYVEDTSGDLEMNVTSNAAGAGSFSGDLVTAVVPTSSLYNTCPLSAGAIAASGSTVAL